MKKVSIGTKPTQQPADADEWVQSRKVESGGEEEPVKMKRLTIDVSESLHRQIKTKCAQQGLKMADEIRDLLEKHFGE